MFSFFYQVLKASCQTHRYLTNVCKLNCSYNNHSPNCPDPSLHLLPHRPARQFPESLSSTLLLLLSPLGTPPRPNLGPHAHSPNSTTTDQANPFRVREDPGAPHVPPTRTLPSPQCSERLCHHLQVPWGILCSSQNSFHPRFSSHPLSCVQRGYPPPHPNLILAPYIF